MLGNTNIKNGTIFIDTSKERLIFKDPVSTLDKDWVKSNFLLSLSEMDHLEDITLFTTSADRKLTSTGLGRSLAINAPYSFTRYTDPPVPGRMLGNTYMNVSNLETPLGQGTYYSNAIDDNNSTSLLFLVPGVVKFASLFSVLTRAVSYKTSVIANEGRYPTMYDVGNFIGGAAIFLFFPVRTLLIWTFKSFTKTLTLVSDASYYSIKPTPRQYWSMVQNITNSLAAERGILAFNMKPNSERVGANYTYDNYRMDYLKYNFPNLFTSANGVNVFSVVTRAQKNLTGQLLTEAAINAKPVTGQTESTNAISGKVKYDEASSYVDFIKDTEKSPLYKVQDPVRDEVNSNEEDLEDVNDVSTTGIKPLPSESGSYLGDMLKVGLSAASHGADGPVFHVEFVGPTTDTFANTIKDIPLKDKINSIGGAARDIRFSLAGGNIVGDMVDSVTNGVKDLVAGTASGLSFGISDLMFGLMSGGYMRFGKMWSDSTAQLESFTFKVRLGGPYNNKISQLIDQDIPTAMLLALVLPQSAGAGSYTSPLMVKAFMRGVCNLDRAMITSLTVTKGKGNLGYTRQGKATNLEMAITITDMSELLVAPLGDSIFNSFNQESSLGRYISTLAGRDYRTNAFLTPKLKMAASIMAQNVSTKFSAESLGVHAADTTVGDIVGLLIPDVLVSTFNETTK